jgi:hypothetical protein
MPNFLVICWGFPLLVIALVAGFEAEGDGGENTGGWCWIRDDPPYGDEWIWILVGGKLVEWLSCFVITPWLYFLTYLRLSGIRKLMDQNRR